MVQLRQLSLRYKTILLILTTNLLLVAIIYGVFARNWFNTIVSYERSAIQSDLKRIENTLETELENLSVITADWSAWDDTYQFVQDHNPEYIESNLNETTFSNLELNLIAIVASDGTIAYAEFFDLNREEFTESPAELLPHLSSDSILLAHPTTDSEIKGLLPLDGKYLLIASRPILTSFDQGPIRGAVIFGRIIDRLVETALAEQTQTSLRLIPLEEAKSNPQLIPALEQTMAQYQHVANEPQSVHEGYISISPNAVAGYLLLEDLYHQPALLLSVHRPREIYQSASQSVLFSAVALLITSAMLSLLMVRGLDQSVLKRLTRIQATIHRITSQRDPSLRLQETQADELGQLATDINEMLESLAQSKAALQHAQAELMEKAAQLSEMNQTLQAEIEERRQVEFALRQSEARYRHLVENVPIGLYRTDKDSHLLDANRTFANMLGYESETMLIGADLRQFLVNPQDLERENELIDADGVVRGYELQIRRRDGTTLWMRDTFQAVFDENGDLLFYEGSLEDVEQQKHAERVEKAIFEIAQAALVIPSLKDFFERVHQLVSELMPAKNFYIALYDPNQDRLSFPYFVDEFDPPPPPKPLGKGLTDWIIRHQKPLLVDPPEFERMAARGEVELIGAPSIDWLGVPLTSAGGQALGAMVVQTYDEGTRYSYGDLNVLSVISAQVALAIERKSAEEEVRRQQDFLRQVIDINPSMIFVKDRQSRYVLANQALATAYQTTVTELIGKTDAELHPHPEEVEIYLRSDQEVIHTLREKVLPTVPLTDNQGRTRWYYTVKRPLVGIFEDVHVLGVSTDITERKLAEEKLSYNAYHDALTGLPNRLLFTDRLEHLLDRVKRHDHKEWFAVMFLDLDHFKSVNDTLGHVLGDQLLIMVAKRLQMALRASDTIARFGGDEFVILLEDLATLQDATQVAERILTQLIHPFNLAGQEVNLSGSIGIVLSTSDYEKSEDLLRDADIAMYRAKALGRNRYVIFNTTMRTFVVKQLELEQELRYAIEHEQLELHYQPISDMDDNRIIGFEALVRWRHPEKGLIPPSEFIPFAEESGLILPMGNWVLHQACRQMRQWQERYPSHPPLTVSVNLSNKQFSQPDLFEQVESALQESGLPPQSLQLEITESVIMENAELTIATLERLVAMGVKIHIDDFGTGYSSLAYLHLLPIHAIKIDRSFISGQSSESNGMEIAKTIINLAHDLKIDTIAEGVETERQWESLRDWKCEYAQGYLIAKVLDAEQAEAFLRDSIQRKK
ncbi:MAG: hypothetical protein Kow0088_22040 [Anaerolineales bacterium]